MSRAAVEQLLYMMDKAFDEAGQESLMSDLRSVREDDCLWRPRGGRRTIRQITGHIGACKYMYDNYAFGDGSMTWNDPAGALGVSMEELQSAAAITVGEPAMRDVVEWLREGHRRLREHVEALDDAELSRERRPPEGKTQETRWIVANLVRHDAYHAGEINHIRALRHQEDGWAWETDSA